MPLHAHACARRHAWWLLAVLVLGLLAPGISAALAHARGDYAAWQDICRSPASRLIQQAPDQDPADAALDLLAKGHCPACHLSWTDLAGPPTQPQAPLRADLAFDAPERFWSAPKTAHAWQHAEARAPPVLN